LRLPVASYEDAFALVRAHAEAGWTGRLVPLTWRPGILRNDPAPVLDPGPHPFRHWITIALSIACLH
jgi:hypothetical protein